MLLELKNAAQRLWSLASIVRCIDYFSSLLPPPPSKLKKPYGRILLCSCKNELLWRHISVSNNENFNFSQHMFLRMFICKLQREMAFSGYSVLQISSCSYLLITAVKTEKSMFPLDILSSTYFLNSQLRLMLWKEIMFLGSFIFFYIFFIHQ